MLTFTVTHMHILNIYAHKLLAEAHIADAAYEAYKGKYLSLEENSIYWTLSLLWLLLLCLTVIKKKIKKTFYSVASLLQFCTCGHKTKTST